MMLPLRSMLNGEGIFGEIREILWFEGYNIEKLLYNILYKKVYHSEESSTQYYYQVFYRKLPKYFSVFISFGENGILKQYITEYNLNFRTRVIQKY